MKKKFYMVKKKEGVDGGKGEGEWRRGGGGGGGGVRGGSSVVPAFILAYVLHTADPDSLAP